MHIPDGFLDPIMCGVTYVISVACLGYAYTVASRRHLWTAENISLLSCLSAAIFAAQMLNWPLPGGTSLHFVGGALAAILLGVWLAMFAIFLVLLVQCLVFHDGGITTLGANVLNMAIIDVFVGWLMYRILTRHSKSNRNRFIGAFLGGWLGITLAGIACGFEIGLSPAFPYGWTISVPVMGSWHALLGVIEGLITAMVVTYVARKAPHMIISER